MIIEIANITQQFLTCRKTEFPKNVVKENDENISLSFHAFLQSPEITKKNR